MVQCTDHVRGDEGVQVHVANAKHEVTAMSQHWAVGRRRLTGQLTHTSQVLPWSVIIHIVSNAVTCTHAHTHTNSNTHVHTLKHASIQTLTHKHTHTLIVIHTHTHPNTHAYTHTHTSTHTRMHTHTHTH